MPHPLRHGVSVYNGHRRGPVTLKRIAKRLTVELPLLRSVAARIRTLRLRGEHSDLLHHAPPRCGPDDLKCLI